MLDNWLLTQLNTNYYDYVLQLDGALAHFHTDARVLLNRVPPQRWTERAANGDNNLLLGHPVRRISHHAIYFLWGFVKDSVYGPPLPKPIQELHDRVTHALQAITADRLHRVWDEFDYRVTQEPHTEQL
jgi:hypothetical protein